MASRGLFTTTHLAPLLAERGIELSASQIHRLVTGTPERLSLPVLAALCDILEVTPAELIAHPRRERHHPQGRRTGTTKRAHPAADLATFRPKRARLRPDDDT